MVTDAEKVVLTLDSYQALASATAMELSTRQEALACWGMSLAGEVGELLNLLKKILWHGKDFDVEKVTEEAGDILWYLAMLCDSVDISLSEVAERNIVRMQRRYPHGFEKRG
jgi:NTP pyrophosphatase (non-canonical NTP hydrolase)